MIKMDNNLYYKISISITDPKAWAIWVLSVPKKVYNEIIQPMIPDKKRQMVKREMFRLTNPTRSISQYKLPNGDLHGKYVRCSLITFYDDGGRSRTRWVRNVEIMYQDNKKNGQQTEYGDDKVVAKISMFKNDKLHGVCRSFHRNGNIKSIEEFQNGIRCGKYQVYNEFGEVTGEQEYDKNGLPHGKHISGNTTKYFNHGVLHGTETVTNGIMNVYSCEWANGERHGERIQYNPQTGDTNIT